MAEDYKTVEVRIRMRVPEWVDDDSLAAACTPAVPGTVEGMTVVDVDAGCHVPPRRLPVPVRSGVDGA